MRERLARIDGKLDAIALQHAGPNAPLETTSSDYAPWRKRLRALEKWKYALLIGALGAICRGRFDADYRTQGRCLITDSLPLKPFNRADVTEFDGEQNVSQDPSTVYASEVPEGDE